MSRLLALLAAVVIILISPAAVLSWQLSTGLRRDLGAAGAVVQVLAGPIGIATGRIARLRFRVDGASVEGVTIHTIRATLRGVALDPRQALQGRFAVQDLAGGTAALVVSEADLQAHLAGTKDVQNARVRLADGVATITGSVNVLNSTFDVDLRARLAVSDGRFIMLRVESLGIGGVALPSPLGNALATAVNPLVTAPERPIPIRFREVTVGDGRAVITGEPVR